MKKNLLLMGIAPGILKDIEHREDLKVFAIEEHSIFKSNYPNGLESKNLENILFGGYINSIEYLEILESLHERVTIHGIIPVREYSVLAAAQAAAKLRLPGLGINAAEAFRNKNILREKCSQYDINQPRFKKIKTYRQLCEFYDGHSLIFKPANRQASLGISRIDQSEDLEAAWHYTTTASEDAKRMVEREFEKEYIAEELIIGPEFSIETLVQNGAPIFSNITRKTSTSETYVELQHIVPANIQMELGEKLLEQKYHLIKSLKVEDGILHSEWKVDNDKPYLLECAGRIPGDSICDLITHSYQFNLCNSICDISLGNQPKVYNTPQFMSAIRFLTPTTGLLKEIKNKEALNCEQIIKWQINVKPGGEVKPLSSSWNRAGYFIASEKDHNSLYELIEKVDKELTFITVNS